MTEKYSDTDRLNFIIKRGKYSILDSTFVGSFKTLEEAKPIDFSQQGVRSNIDKAIDKELAEYGEIRNW